MRLRSCIARTFLACLLSPRAGNLYAQNITGAILGKVTDPSGAGVPKAEVVATEQATNQASRTFTNEAGSYELSYLRPGNYSIKVSAAGFKSVVREGLPVTVDSRARLDFSVEVGDATTSISVVGEAPVVQSNQSSLSQLVTTRSVQDLPIKGRNIFDLAVLSPGVNVNPRAQGAVASTGDNSAPLFVMSDISINGGRYRTNDYLLDGVSIMLPENNDFAISPTPDSTQEFQILTNNAGPQFGRSGGGVLNVVTRSGTNQWHGSAYEYFRNDRTEANNFFANAHNQARGPFHFNLFGASAGAPIRKDKTFFFADYQGHRARSSLAGQLATLPTALQRQGDFSQTYNQSGQLVTLYDPNTTQSTGTGYVRSSYPGNRIPSSQINAVAAKMLPYIPLPNQPGTGPAGVNNFAWAQQAFVNSDQWNVRIDQRFSDRHSLFGRITRNTGNSGNTGPFNNVADNVLGIDVSHVINGVLNDTLTLNATTLLNLRFGVTRRYEGRTPIHGGIDLTSLGFPASVASAATQQVFPAMSVANYTSWGDPSGDAIRRGNDIYTLVGDTTWVRGSHTLIFGADVRMYNQTPYQGGADAGSYSFSQGFTQGPNPQVSSLSSGDGFASFLTGYGSGSISQTPALAIRNWYTALYFNDEIKLGKLTINAGLRWDYEQPRTERYNRFSTFDFSSAFPVQVSGLTALKGVLTHPGQNGQPRGQFDPYWKAFGPRFGMAYALNSKTAIRAGYGLFYSPRFGTTSAGNFGSAGATINTAWVASLDGVTPLNPITNPFPTGVFQAPVTTADQVLLGQGILLMDRRNLSNSYNQQWNLNIQRELAGGILVEAGYAGNRGVHLPIGIDFDQINPIYQSLGSGLSAQVPNPFFGLVSTGVLSTRTVAQSQLLRPYPQYTSLSTSSPAVAENEGNSLYNALQIKLEKRFSKGIGFLVSYTNSKVIDNASGRIFGVNGFVPPVQNIYNLAAERSVSEGDISQQLVISHTLELPLGRGKSLLGNVPAPVNSLIGGWSINGTLTMFTGFPLALTSTGNSGVGGAVLRPNSTGTSAALGGTVESRLTRYFDISQFTVPAPFTFGNVARTLPDVRSPGRRNYDLSLQKRFPVKERLSVLFRAEAFNLTNTPYFSGPGVGLGSGTFGVISSASGDRQVQFTLKVLF
jgi:hypothetical protein